jgi:hypothetical protein
MKTLSYKEKRALVALLSCLPRKEAASWAGISRTTLWRYERKPEFQAAYWNEIEKIAQPQIKQLYSKAIKKAGKLLDNKSAKVQLAVIDIIFAHKMPGYSKN